MEGNRVCTSASPLLTPSSSQQHEQQQAWQEHSRQQDIKTRDCDKTKPRVEMVDDTESRSWAGHRRDSVGSRISAARGGKRGTQGGNEGKLTAGKLGGKGGTLGGGKQGGKGGKRIAGKQGGNGGKLTAGKQGGKQARKTYHSPPPSEGGISQRNTITGVTPGSRTGRRATAGNQGGKTAGKTGGKTAGKTSSKTAGKPAGMSGGKWGGKDTQSGARPGSKKAPTGSAARQGPNSHGGGSQRSRSADVAPSGIGSQRPGVSSTQSGNVLLRSLAGEGAQAGEYDPVLIDAGQGLIRKIVAAHNEER